MVFEQLFLGGVLETAKELYFVLQVMTFSYLLFWLYMTFRDAQLIFGLSAIIAGYVIFLHGLSTILLAVFFLVFVVLGSQLQMLIWFGIMPLLGYQQAGDKFVSIKEAEEMQEQQEQMKNTVMQRIMEGNASSEEQQWAVHNVVGGAVGGGPSQEGRIRAGMH